MILYSSLDMKHQISIGRLGLNQIYNTVATVRGCISAAVWWREREREGGRGCVRERPPSPRLSERDRAWMVEANPFLRGRQGGSLFSDLEFPGRRSWMNPMEAENNGARRAR
jgi:hypothetical protein